MCNNLLNSVIYQSSFAHADLWGGGLLEVCELELTFRNLSFQTFWPY